MNGTSTPRVDRSVQLAAMAAPTTSVVEAVAEARRRRGPEDAWIATHLRTRPLVPASV